MRPLETMFPELPGQKVEGEAADLIKTDVSGESPGQKADGNSAQRHHEKYVCRVSWAGSYQ